MKEDGCERGDEEEFSKYYTARKFKNNGKIAEEADKIMKYAE
jgi:hypothetical protein